MIGLVKSYRSYGLPKVACQIVCFSEAYMQLTGSSPSVHRDVQSMGMSASLLSQTFCLLLRQLAETLDPLWDKCSAPSLPDTLHVSEGEPKDLYDFVWEELQDVWTWLFNCLDVLQSQLSFGSIVSKKVRHMAVYIRSQ